MGLEVTVGLLAMLKDSGEDTAENEKEFVKINALLRVSKLPEQHEPPDLVERDYVSYGMIGYGGLHYLRRIAAHLWAEGRLPPPGDPKSPKDPVTDQYFANIDRVTTGPGAGTRPPARFEHLMNHSDADGFYIPVQFNRVILDNSRGGVQGAAVGSSQALLRECEELARELELPLGMDPESKEIWESTRSQGQGEVLWKKYALESFACSRLYYASKASIDLGAAIVFQ